MIKKTIAFFMLLFVLASCGGCVDECETAIEMSSFTDRYLTLARSKEAAYGGDWEQALLGADFVRSQMVGNDIREYVRIIENNRAYELFTLFDQENREFADFHETRLFISDIVDGEYRYLISFDIPNRRANAYGGLVFTDVDFDGVNDVLVWLGHEGNQGVITYSAFLNRGDTYIVTNFYEIPFPAISCTREKILGGVRNWAASHSSFLYMFIAGEFIMTDSFIREVCRYTHELMYIITLCDGQEVNEVYFYPENQVKIFELFYAEDSKWGLDRCRWRNVFDMH